MRGFQPRNWGSNPHGSIQPYRTVASPSGFEPENAGSSPARVRVNMVLGFKDYDERLHMDINNYAKFSEEKMKMIYEKMIS